MLLKTTDNARLAFLDYAKGIAIILVVAGHYYPDRSPEVWHLLRAFIYKFHMPVFFFVSGFLFHKELIKNSSFSTVVRKKFFRLGLPFLVLILILGGIKLLAGLVVTLEHPVVLASFIHALVWPLNSYSPQLWFLQAILIVFILYSFLHITLKLNYWLILLISLAMSFVSITDYFSINSALREFNYFCLGLIFAKFCLHERINYSLSGTLGVALMGLAFIVFVYTGESAVGQRVASYCGIFGVLSLALFCGGRELQPLGWLKSVGFYSMGIYLFHTIFGSSVRIVYYQILKLPDAYFWFGFFVAVSSGVIFSLLFEKFILRRFQLTRKFVLGFN